MYKRGAQNATPAADTPGRRKVADLPVTVNPRPNAPGTVQHVRLGDVLERFRDPKPEVRELIRRIRATEDKAARNALKKQLPVVIFSGRFAYRNERGIQAYSGLACIDLDAQDNPDLVALKDLLAQDGYVLAVFASASGRGLKLLVRLSELVDPAADVEALRKAHRAGFEAFRSYLRDVYGLVADTTPDLSRGCYVTWDPDLRVNWDACLFPFRHIPEQAPAARPSGDGAVDLELVESALEAIPMGPSFPYPDWLRIGLALAGTLGVREAVRLMLTYGGGHPGDTPEYLERTFRSARGEIGLGTIFWYAQQYGWRPPRKQRAAGDGQPRLLGAGDVLAELDSPDPDWLVDELLPCGGVSVLVGKPKSGKTTLARAIAVAVAQGRPVLGRNVLQGKVLYLALEGRLRDHARHLAQLGLQPNTPLFVATQATLQAVERWLAEHRFALVVVDTLGVFLKIREINEYGHVLNAVAPALRLAVERGTHLLFLHHSGKGSDARDAIDAPLGSTAIAGSADVVLHIKRFADGVRTLTTVQRIGEDLPETVLMLENNGWVRLQGDVLAFRAERAKALVLEALEAEGPMPRQVLLEALAAEKIKRDAAARALKLLVEEGRVVRLGSGKKGDPFIYALPGTTPEDVAGTDAVQQALELLPETFGPREFRQALGVSRRTAFRRLEELVQQGVLEHLDRGRYRKVTSVADSLEVSAKSCPFAKNKGGQELALPIRKSAPTTEAPAVNRKQQVLERLQALFDAVPVDNPPVVTNNGHSTAHSGNKPDPLAGLRQQVLELAERQGWPAVCVEGLRLEPSGRAWRKAVQAWTERGLQQAMELLAAGENGAPF